MHVRTHDTAQVIQRTSSERPHLREPRSHRSRESSVELQSAERRAPEARETEASAASLRYQRSEKTTLHLRTQEGDVVRIKFRARESLKVEAEQGGEADAESTELELSARSSSKLSIKIQGDLNAEELAAIRDAVDQAMHIADAFFRGDLQAAFETASALDVDGEQLARVKLKLRVRESVTYTAQGFASVPAKSGPAEGARVETPSQRPEEASVGVPETGANPLALSQVLQAIGEFLDLTLGPLSAVDGERPEGSLHLSLKIRIVQSTILTLSGTQADDGSPLPALVTETLDALALQEQAPVDQVA